MELAQRIVAYVGPATMLVILAGVLVRRLYRVCHSFPVYIATVLVGDVLMLAWPSRFFNWGFWLLKETTYSLLCFAIALELTGLVFQAFPGAQATARRALLLALGLILVGVLSVPAGPDNATLAQQVQPRVANGTALLFAALWGLILWYHLPVHAFHLALLQGLVPYLLVTTVLLRLLGLWGWDVREWMGLADSLAYLLMLLYWAWAAWRPQPPPPAGPSLVQRLQPWRARL